MTSRNAEQGDQSMRTACPVCTRLRASTWLVITVLALSVYILERSRSSARALRRIEPLAHGGSQNAGDKTAFLVLYAGHVGSSAFLDALGLLPDVYVPGFEPLDVEGLDGPRKLDWMDNLFSITHDDGFEAGTWLNGVLQLGEPWRPRVNATKAIAVATSSSTPHAVGFKMRPFPGQHTAWTGMDPWALRETLARHNVRVVVMMRRNALKQAISWHLARDQDISQFAREPDSAEDQDIQLDVVRVRLWIKYVERTNLWLVSAARFLGRPWHVVWHEDYIADAHQTLSDTASFLGLPSESRASSAIAAAVAAQAFTKKRSDDLASAGFNNTSELARAFMTDWCWELGPRLCPPRIPDERQADDVPHGLADPASAMMRHGDVSFTGYWEMLSKDMEASTPLFSGLSARQAAMQYDTGRRGRLQSVRARQRAVIFKHEHKAGGTTLCRVARLFMSAPTDKLPGSAEWDANCIPIEAFARPAPPWVLTGEPSPAGEANSMTGGACWFGQLDPAQQEALTRTMFPAFDFFASEGPLPDAMALGAPHSFVTMLRRPQDRTLSAYHWWKSMVAKFGPYNAPICHSFWAPQNSTLESWLEVFPDNWQTRTMLGKEWLLGAARREIGDEDLRNAVWRLHLFDGVLLVEDVEGSSALLRSRFGWDPAGIGGVSAERPEELFEIFRHGSRRDSNAADELRGSKAADQMRRLHEYDEQLYAYASRLHCRQLSQDGIDSAFCADLRNGH
ncbi:unnamed protein product [Pedinophyceae sp. YPF-701]|nr:unnamed protein product [Pedinophyceae sp. YPF-701]